MVAPPCGCGKPVAVGPKRTSRARREQGESYARSGFSGSDKRRREGEHRQERLAAVAGVGGGEDEGGEASRAGENRERMRRGRGGSSSSRDSRRRITTWRSNATKRSRSRAIRGSGRGNQLPLFFPARKGRSASAGIKRIFGAWFSSRRLTATIAAAVLAVASAQEEVGEPIADTAELVMVPLASAGLQYTVNVTITNSSSTASLILDTTKNIVAFPACGEAFRDNDTCVPYEDPQDSRWQCIFKRVDSGSITLDHNFTQLANQEISLSGDVSAVGDLLALENTTTVSGDSGTLEGWDGSSGIFGLGGYPNTVCLNDDSPAIDGSSDRSVFARMVGANQYFALDLGDEDYDSTLEIGGFSGASSETVGDIQWGEAQTATFPNTWGFPAFDLGVCGRGMMGNVTSVWPAVVSTASACLGLPEEFFDSLMAWLPVRENCPAQADGALLGTMCSVASEDAAEELPSLSFRLSHDGPRLYIPLSSLLLKAEDEGEEEEEGEETDEDESPDPGGAQSGDRRLCVTRLAPIRGSGWVFSTQPVVSFGALTLRSLYTVVDTDAGRVGLAQKGQEDDRAALGEAGNTSCQPAAECVGMQSFKESKNACEGPACSSYYFTNLDEETMTCKSSGAMKTLAWVFGVFFGVTEMAGHFLRAYYGATGVGLRGHQHHQGWEFHTGRLLEACLGKATRALGQSSHQRND